MQLQTKGSKYPRLPTLGGEGGGLNFNSHILVRYTGEEAGRRYFSFRLNPKKTDAVNGLRAF
jgi:hypothetical protein